MKFMLFVLPTVPGTLEDRKRLRPIGRNNEQYALAGTPDQVKREIETLHRIGNEGELEWFGWFFDQGFMSLDQEMRQMETFAKHIIPAFRQHPAILRG